MVEYLTFREYTEMGGTITEESLFKSLAIDAQGYIDWYTFNRLWNEETIPERVKLCMFQLIKLINAKNAMLIPETTPDGGKTAQLKSMSNDGVTVEYSVMSADSRTSNLNNEIEECIKRYLNGVMNSMGKKLLYRGLYSDE